MKNRPRQDNIIRQDRRKNIPRLPVINQPDTPGKVGPAPFEEPSPVPRPQLKPFEGGAVDTVPGVVLKLNDKGKVRRTQKAVVLPRSPLVSHLILPNSISRPPRQGPRGRVKRNLNASPEVTHTSSGGGGAIDTPQEASIFNPKVALIAGIGVILYLATR